MKLNIPVRLKNPWFWVGIVSVIVTTVGVDATTLTSWAAVQQAVLAVLANPVQLISAGLAVLAVFVDPTTAGISDSAQALTYQNPAK